MLPVFRLAEEGGRWEMDTIAMLDNRNRDFSIMGMHGGQPIPAALSRRRSSMSDDYRVERADCGHSLAVRGRSGAPEGEGASGGAATDRGDARCGVLTAGEACPGYDTRRREWRNLDAWGYKTLLVCNVPAGPVPGARGGHHPGALGGGEFEVHGPVRGGSDRLAEGGRRADAAELERGGRNHATCGGARTCAPQGGGGPAPFGGRDQEARIVDCRDKPR